MRRALGLAAAALLAGSLHAQSADPVATVDAFHRALASGDSATALRLLAPDVIVYESGGAVASRDEYRRHHLPADMRYAASTTRNATVQRADLSGDVAWVLSQVHTTGSYDGREVDRRGVETMVLRRTSDGWRIVHIHWSSGRQ